MRGAQVGVETQMSVKQLRAFVAVYRLRKLASAAEHLSVTQSAVSLLIRETERNLGVQLFDRTTRTLEPTQAAHEAIELAERILNDIALLGSNFRDTGALRQGKVHLAATPAISMALLPTAVQQFTRQYPNVRVVLDDCAPNQFVQHIVSDQVEFGIGTPDGPAGGLDVSTLIDDHLCVVCRRDDPLASFDEVPWSQLRGVPMIAGTPGYGVRRMTDAAAAQAGIELKIINEVSYLSSALWMVSSGLGVAIFPSALATLSADVDTVVRPLVEPRVMRSISLVTRHGRSLSPACTSFMSLLMKDLQRREVPGLKLDSPWLV
ncbi:LysR family transcriptional regulator [soil metagenome]